MRFTEFFAEDFKPRAPTFADGTLRISKHVQDRSRERDIPMDKIMRVLQRLEAVRGDDLKKLPPTAFIVKTPENFELAIVKTQNIDTKKIEYVVATVRQQLKPAAGQRVVYLENQITEISDAQLQRYLEKAGQHVDRRMDRMARVRDRLNKGYEIYHADRPAGSGQIVHRFEANTPELARRYYERFIQNYESDVDFDLRLRRSTGIVEYVERPPALINKTADVDGIQVSVNADGAHVTAYATSNGKRLGYVVFDRDANVLVPYDLAVEERYRGQGIAAVMYDYVKSLGFKIKASDDQTDAGKYFWQKNRGRKRVWESVEAYHGTFQPTLTKFNALSHFGTLKAAEDRLKEKARREKIRTPGRVYEVILDIKNPFIAKDFAGVHSPTHFVFDLKKAGLISQEELEAINKYVGQPRQKQLLIKKLRELGFDSIAYKNKYEDKGSTSYVILDPTQVVSVKPIEQKQPVAEARIPRAIEEFIDSLSPDDVGVEDIGPYRIHFEGFTDDCKSSRDYRRNPEAVYQQVFNDFIAREGGARPLVQDMTGDEDYPILYSIFKRKKVNEIARIPKSELGGWGDEGTITPPEGKIKKKELPGGSGYTYAVNKTGKGDLEIMIFDGEEIAAELDLFETQDVLGTWGVETVVVRRPYRGQGLAKALYGIALSILGLTLEAGQMQTAHGQKMWLMLNSIPGVEVLGYNMVPTDKYQAHKGDNIVQQDDEWTRYTFPVHPGKRSMRSGRKGTGLYTTQATMIARWTGR